jgi:hypothetical protein
MATYKKFSYFLFEMKRKSRVLARSAPEFLIQLHLDSEFFGLDVCVETQSRNRKMSGISRPTFFITVEIENLSSLGRISKEVLET